MVVLLSLFCVILTKHFIKKEGWTQGRSRFSRFCQSNVVRSRCGKCTAFLGIYFFDSWNFHGALLGTVSSYWYYIIRMASSLTWISFHSIIFPKTLASSNVRTLLLLYVLFNFLAGSALLALLIVVCSINLCLLY